MFECLEVAFHHDLPGDSQGIVLVSEQILQGVSLADALDQVGGIGDHLELLEEYPLLLQTIHGCKVLMVA